MATRIKGFCSHCFKNSYHIEQQWNALRRNVYVCDACHKSTVQCRFCQNFAKGGDFYDDELCAEHDGTIKSFQKKNEKKLKTQLYEINKLNSELGYELKKVKDGKGESIIFMDGFLNEENSNRKEWEKEFKNLYPNNPWYSLTWKSKKLVDFVNIGHLSSHYFLRFLPMSPIFHAPIAITHIIKVWKEAKNTAEQTGIHFGDILKEIKNEEVILCGHSLGARVIYYALVQISQQKPSINKTIIKEVHLLGGAISNTYDNWSYASKCVSGTIYNYYSKNDDILKYMYQIVEVNTSTPIGRNAINMSGVKNKDVSSRVSGHTEYISNFSKFHG